MAPCGSSYAARVRATVLLPAQAPSGSAPTSSFCAAASGGAGVRAILHPRISGRGVPMATTGSRTRSCSTGRQSHGAHLGVAMEAATKAGEWRHEIRGQAGVGGACEAQPPAHLTPLFCSPVNSHCLLLDLSWPSGGATAGSSFLPDWCHLGEVEGSVALGDPSIGTPAPGPALGGPPAGDPWMHARSSESQGQLGVQPPSRPLPGVQVTWPGVGIEVTHPALGPGLGRGRGLPQQLQ